MKHKYFYLYDVNDGPSYIILSMEIVYRRMVLGMVLLYY